MEMPTCILCNKFFECNRSCNIEDDSLCTCNSCFLESRKEDEDITFEEFHKIMNMCGSKMSEEDARARYLAWRL